MDTVSLNKYKAKPFYKIPNLVNGKIKFETKKDMAANIGSLSVVQNIYHYLWSKDPLFTVEKLGPQVYLPDTIIYSYNQPSFWYFTSTKPVQDPFGIQMDQVKQPATQPQKVPRIFKKTRGKLKNDEIEKAFLKKGTIGPSGIVAVFFYFKPSDKKIKKKRNHSQDPRKKNGSQDQDKFKSSLREVKEGKDQSGGFDADKNHKEGKVFANQKEHRIDKGNLKGELDRRNEATEFAGNE